MAVELGINTGAFLPRIEDGGPRLSLKPHEQYVGTAELKDRHGNPIKDTMRVLVEKATPYGCEVTVDGSWRYKLSAESLANPNGVFNRYSWTKVEPENPEELVVGKRGSSNLRRHR